MIESSGIQQLMSCHSSRHALRDEAGGGLAAGWLGSSAASPQGKRRMSSYPWQRLSETLMRVSERLAHIGQVSPYLPLA